ncbi:hypothetical protein C3L29_013515 [Pseudomonas sp. MWU12-2534b]|nr:hypothetical protein C3L29_013515 [Pseudomonas sp. MWU12-2534b]
MRMAFPTQNAMDEHVFKPNMSFTNEPNPSLHNEDFGIKPGDTLLCGPEGSSSLSTLAPELRISHRETV